MSASISSAPPTFDWEGDLFPSAGLEALLLKQEPLDLALGHFQDLGDLYAAAPVLPSVSSSSSATLTSWLDDFTTANNTLISTTLSADMLDLLKRPLVAPVDAIASSSSSSSAASISGDVPEPINADDFMALFAAATAQGVLAPVADETGTAATTPADETATAATTASASTTCSQFDSDTFSSLFSEDEDEEGDFGDLLDSSGAFSASSKRAKVSAPKGSKKSKAAAAAAAANNGANRRRKHVQDMSEEERVHVRELGRLAAQRSRQARRQRWLDLKRRGKSLDQDHKQLSSEKAALLAKLEALKQALKASYPAMVTVWSGPDAEI